MGKVSSQFNQIVNLDLEVQQREKLNPYFPYLKEKCPDTMLMGDFEPEPRAM